MKRLVVRKPWRSGDCGKKGFGRSPSVIWPPRFPRSCNLSLARDLASGLLSYGVPAPCSRNWQCHDPYFNATFTFLLQRGGFEVAREFDGHVPRARCPVTLARHHVAHAAQTRDPAKIRAPPSQAIRLQRQSRSRALLHRFETAIQPISRRPEHEPMTYWLEKSLSTASTIVPYW